ncbi:hypothetical protein [Noviherbaspirillum denitrificans]|uniref:Nucleotidyltransferase family protein n=1 Tax=Noviherbaspirillum denitrificans TaxID=1968433 RepID=A0A254T888_9BURK|nr:hypothetical protein [Noviherbaspirillum denitrificans]OWW18367.1 hypothetical protein AYR66_01225 [Noviherbaspirillum denitrificans]
MRWLMNAPRTYIFGGLVRHIVNPTVHPTYSDIDLITVDIDLLDRLRDELGYVFRGVSRLGSSPQYFLAKSPRFTKTIQLIFMQSHAQVMLFINNAQYDIDRVAYGDQRFYFDPSIGGEDVIRRAINAKRATFIQGPRDMSLFSPNRRQIELRHRWKLIQKGFTIID